MPTKTMPGVVNFDKQAYSVEMRDVPVPEIGDNDVLLRVGAVGVCGSDLHQWMGTQSWAVHYPVVLGHEFGGTIVQVGKNVKGWAEGDRVVSETAAVIDENTPWARQGLYNLDPDRLGFGYGVSGAMTSWVRVPARCLHRIPPGLSFEKAALTEPCCVAYNAVCINGRIRPGDSIMVIGPGPIGLLCAQMAKLSGANPLVVVGAPHDAARLSVAQTLGADAVLGANGEDVAQWVKNYGDGYGVDVVIDAAGVSQTLKLALDVVRPAGQIVKVGWGPQPLNFSLDQLVQKAVTLQGSFSHNWPIWERVLQMLASGQINLDPILNQVAPLEQWHETFEAMHNGRIVKAVLTP